MKSLAPMCAIVGLGLVATSCATYTGVSKSPDGELYISGATSYFVFSEPWVRRCTVDGMRLNCVELSEAPKAATGTTAGATAPATSSEPAAVPAAEAPAPAPEPQAAPAKSKK